MKTPEARIGGQVGKQRSIRSSGDFHVEAGSCFGTSGCKENLSARSQLTVLVATVRANPKNLVAQPAGAFEVHLRFIHIDVQGPGKIKGPQRQTALVGTIDSDRIIL